MISIGFGNFVNEQRVVAVVSPETAPIKRLIQSAKEEGVLIDVTFGRKTRSVIILDSKQVVICPLQTETLIQRFDIKKY